MMLSMPLVVGDRCRTPWRHPRPQIFFMARELGIVLIRTSRRGILVSRADRRYLRLVQLRCTS